VKGEAGQLRGQPLVHCGWHLVDPLFKPVAGVDVTLKQGDEIYGTARSDKWGWVRADLPPEKFTLTCKTPGRATLQRDLDLTKFKPNEVLNTEYEVETPSVVV